MATVLDVITAALLDLGVLSEGEEPTAAQADQALKRLNRLLDQWKSEPLTIYTVTRTTFTITSGVETYAVGSGSTVNIARPVLNQVQHIKFQDTAVTPTQEYDLGDLLTDDQYAAIPIKDQESTLPQKAYYNPTYPTGTITFWPVPTSSTLQGVVYVLTAVPQFSATSDSVALPPGYQRMLETNLAKELAPSFNRQLSPDLRQMADESKAAVKRSNTKLTDMRFETAALVGSRRYAYRIERG